jgi:lysophospholipase L1-like esterase
VRKNSVYRLIVAVSLLSLILFIGGFLWGVQNLTTSQASSLPELPIQPKPTEDKKLNLVALGDSLTRGIGDSNGKGYVGLIQETLQKNLDQEIQVTNLSVSGATSSDLLSQLSQKGALRVISQANIIMMTIGGNDLFRGAGDLQDIDVDKIGEGRKQYLARLEEILSTLTEVNPGASVYLMALYNPFGDLEQSALTNQIVLEWNYHVQELALSYTNVTVVPLADLFHGQLGDVLYTDHFHPNQEGYRRISQRLLQLLEPLTESLQGQEVNG